MDSSAHCDVGSFLLYHLVPVRQSASEVAQLRISCRTIVKDSDEVLDASIDSLDDVSALYIKFWRWTLLG